MRIFFYSILLVVTFSSCHKASVKTLTEHPWRLHSMKQTEDTTWTLADQVYRLILEKKNQAVVYLDVNTCGGEYHLKRKDGISFEIGVCTEACCDSAFSLAMMAGINAASRWKIINDTLLLTGRDSLKFLPFN